MDSKNKKYIDSYEIPAYIYNTNNTSLALQNPGTPSCRPI
jgi:hypothetical protein